MTIGERLKKFAREYPGGIEALAANTNWRPHRLYPILHDREEPTVDLLRALARVGCDLNWLLLGEETDTAAAAPSTKKIPSIEAITAVEETPAAEESPSSEETPHQAEVLPLLPDKELSGSGDVELLPFDALSAKAIRSLNINIKPTDK